MIQRHEQLFWIKMQMYPFAYLHRYLHPHHQMIQRHINNYSGSKCRCTAGSKCRYPLAYLHRYLHPCHQIIKNKHNYGSNCRYPLAKMYGRMAGWEADKLTEEQLKRKQQLCEEVTFTFKDIRKPSKSNHPQSIVACIL